MSSRFRWSKWIAATVVAALAAVPAPAPVVLAGTYYINRSDPTCGNTPGKGLTLDEPYCSVTYAAGIAVPGDTFLVSAGRYGCTTVSLCDSPAEFTRSGSSGNPITWQAVGEVVLGRFIDINDSLLVATATPNVYVMPWDNVAIPIGTTWQTYYDDFDVNDGHNNETPENPTGPVDSSSRFTVSDDNGPLRLIGAGGDATALATMPGVTQISGVAGTLSIHPFGDRVPSVGQTDFVVGLQGNNVNVSANWNVFNGFTITYGGTTNTFVVTGSDNRFLNMDFAGRGFQMSGNRNYAENIRAFHVLGRDITNTAPHYFDFDYHGDGTAMIVTGTGHSMKNIELFHSWNTGIGLENAPGAIVDGLRSHGAPNHTTSLNHTNAVFRNYTLYNGQEGVYWSDAVNVTVENSVLTGSNIGLQMLDTGIGKITIRNSILNGSVDLLQDANIGTGGVPGPMCNWEAGSLFENNIMNAAATIERCGGGGTDIPIATYIANCINGTYTSGAGPCAIYRNNIFVSNFNGVLAQGMWQASHRDAWNPTLTASSPAINAGIVSGTTIDLIGVTRPVGSAYDIGVYEYTGTVTTRPATEVTVAAQAAVTTTITAPTSGTTFNAGSATTLTTLAGTAVSGRTVTACTWTNSLGGGGATTGTTSWTVPSIALTIGSNVITVTCVNDGGTAGSDMLTVTRSSELLAWLRSMRWRRPETGH